MSATADSVAVFEFRPGRGRRRKWICYGCAEPWWKAGKFHDPVVVPAADLEGTACVVCGGLVVRCEECAACQEWLLTPAQAPPCTGAPYLTDDGWSDDERSS